jgi:hypothetical protein
MADRPPVRRRSAGLPQEDVQWLAGFARQENVSVAAAAGHAFWLLRSWEETIKGTITEVLEGIDALCRAHEQELTQLRRGYERRLGTAAGAGRTSLYGPRVAKLLALAVSTNAEGEAVAALAKARALHHPAVL